MAPRPWATPEQLQFLHGKQDAFIEAQKTKWYNQFWSELQNEWFQRWKEEGQDVVPAPEKAEEHRRELGKRIEKRIVVSGLYHHLKPLFDLRRF